MSTARIDVYPRLRSMVKNGFHGQGPAAECVGDSPEKPMFPKCDLGKGMSAQIVLVSPEAAAEMLSRPLGAQRSRRAPNKDMLVRAIKEGKWRLNGSPVIFSRTGKLMGGQHRLAAIEEAGVPVLLLVVTGVEDDALPTIDTGASWTGADAMRSGGYLHSNDLAAASQLIWRYERGLPLTAGGAIKVSPSEIVDTAGENPDLVACLPFALPAAKVIRSAKAAIFCYYKLSRVSEEHARVFFERLASGAGLSEGDPILALRNRFQGGAKISVFDTIHLCFKAWNAFRARKDVKSLRIGSGESLPEPE